MQIEELVFQEQVERLKDKCKIRSDTLKWSKNKQKDHAKECDLCCNISYTIDGTTDVKNPLKLFNDYSEFSILCSKIASESLLRYIPNILSRIGK